MKIPQELIDAIIDQVAAGTWIPLQGRESATLKACSLTARTFVASTGRHLFRSLTLSDSTVARASWRSAASPRVSSSVRDLDIQLRFRNDYNIRRLGSLFPLLTGVERLAISHPPENWQWDRFRAALVDLFCLPTFRCVAFIGCDGVPSSIIRRALLSCKEVVLANVHISTEADIFSPGHSTEADSFPSTAPLDHFTVGCPPDEAASLCLGDKVTSRLKHLRHLELLAPFSGSLRGLDAIALNYSRFLQHLVLRFPRTS
jgi:hypothetical protein